MRTEITTARTVGGEASTALMNTRNARQRDRVNRRMVASVIRRLCLLRGARECDLVAMIYTITEKNGGMPSGFAHVPPGAILPGFAGRKPSGIPAATVL